MATLTKIEYDVELCAVCQQPLRRRQCLATIRSIDPESICPHVLHYECAVELREKCPNVMTLDGKEMKDHTCSPCPSCRRLVDLVELILPNTTGIPAAATSASSASASATSSHEWPEAGRRLGGATADTVFRFGASGQAESGTSGTNYRPLNNNTLNNVFTFGGSPPSHPYQRPQSPDVEIIGMVQGNQPRSSAQEAAASWYEQREGDGFCQHCGEAYHQDPDRRKRCKERRFGPYFCPYPGCSARYGTKSHLQRHHFDKHGYRIYCNDMEGRKKSRKPRNHRR